MAEIEAGLSGTKEMVVGPEDLASFTGNIGAAVLSTHRVVLLMEQAARNALEGRLPEGMITVGTAIRINHLAATPLRARVRADAVVTAAEGRRLLFELKVCDDVEMIAEGENERYIVSVKRFLQKIDPKKIHP